MRITSKGQVTIPRHVRDQLGLLPQTEVEFVVEGTVVYVRKATGAQQRGRRLIEGMRGKASVKMSTDEIMALTRG
ncbi:AbrB/MazE/SpoVT family DNA-binding domain-containing protein [Pelovirga terrestris]|uniref:AbrB/MazE/SpoVT family DNA-binding domain-containing protein n=1 Tax=Pelovirga terrestris TaxID=2771352 RepID=A0A8J6QXN5_9BACT|nr:AbrB/MazE/SpoVT family DNA-binding domain-containing protein [Pelovirga terrestris]MBD1400896.1 AbrB/MazE/SpoVT family DNA-binding domain-containing protein [Pelovirga terrestris]